MTVFEKAIAKYDRYFLSTITVYEVDFRAARAGRMSDLYVILPHVEILGINGTALSSESLPPSNP